MYSSISYKCDNCCACGVIFFCSCSFFEAIYFWSHLWKLLKEEMHPSLFFAFGVLLRCPSTVAVLLGSPAPLCDVAPCDFTYLFTYLPFFCLMLILIAMLTSPMSCHVDSWRVELCDAICMREIELKIAWVTSNPIGEKPIHDFWVVFLFDEDCG